MADPSFMRLDFRRRYGYGRDALVTCNSNWCCWSRWGSWNNALPLTRYVAPTAFLMEMTASTVACSTIVTLHGHKFRERVVVDLLEEIDG